MSAILKIIRTTAAVLAAIGLLAGPIQIILSRSFYGALTDFQEHGTKTTGYVTAKYDNGGFGRSKILFVDVRYTATSGGTAAGRLAERCHPSDKVQRSLHVGQPVELYYKMHGAPSDILLTADYKSENIPPIYHKYAGWIITLYAYGYLLIYQLSKRRNKQTNHEYNR